MKNQTDCLNIRIF